MSTTSLEALEASDLRCLMLVSVSRSRRITFLPESPLLCKLTERSIQIFRLSVFLDGEIKYLKLVRYKWMLSCLPVLPFSWIGVPFQHENPPLLSRHFPLPALILLSCLSIRKIGRNQILEFRLIDWLKCFWEMNIQFLAAVMICWASCSALSNSWIPPSWRLPESINLDWELKRRNIWSRREKMSESVIGRMFDLLIIFIQEKENVSQTLVPFKLLKKIGIFALIPCYFV